MSEYFDHRKECLAVRQATRAFVEVLLDEMLPALRSAAGGCGYALAVHGSLSRDIDLVAIPWASKADDPEFLVQRLCGVMAGFVSRAYPSKDWAEKPHGRRAVTISLPGMIPEIDLSIMPRIEKEKSCTLSG